MLKFACTKAICSERNKNTKFYDKGLFREPWKVNLLRTRGNIRLTLRHVVQRIYVGFYNFFLHF